jgi:gliding motility-associated-like protein
LTIYNQWGDEVYRSGEPYRSDWDGTYQGNTLPVATYFYTIDFGGERASVSGAVRIER